jgi:site-specific DNA-methyltransferase (cytosine-N4-specific)
VAQPEQIPFVPIAEVSCADAYDALAELPPASVNMFCTSPPYWGMRTYGQAYSSELDIKWQEHGGAVVDPPGYEWYRENGGVLGLEPTPDWYVQHLVEILDGAWNTLAGDGSLWVNLGDTYFARWGSIRPAGRQGLGAPERERRRAPSGGYRQDKQLLLIPARFAIAMQDHGWILRNDLIWSKPHVAPRPERDRLRLAHEHFFHFVKRPKRGRASYYYDIKAVEPAALDVVSVRPNPGGNGHPATFPRDLVEPRIRSSCPPGGTVCDPFCGLGMTLEVAVAVGREAIGFDVSATYVDLAKHRLDTLN